MGAAGLMGSPEGVAMHQNVTNVEHLPINQPLFQFIRGQLATSKCKAYVNVWN